MFEDQLFLAVVLEQDGILIKRADLSCEFNSTHQIDRDGALVFADRVQKRILNVLRRL